VLHLALNTNLNEKVIRLLLERGAAIERIGLYRDTTLLRAASPFFEDEPLPVIRSLVEHGANIEARGNRENTQLHCAIIFEKLAIAQLPIDSGANINAGTQRKSGRQEKHSARRRCLSSARERVLISRIDLLMVELYFWKLLMKCYCCSSATVA
jgi:ankyrin repeat protein